MADQDEERKVKVVDRRWFTAEGELREPPPEQATATEEPEPQPATEAAAGPTAPAGPTGPAAPAEPPETPQLSREESSTPTSEGESPLHVPGQPGFVELVDTLAQPAVAFLSGQVPGRGKDLEAARYYIDLLGVLEAKTRGQLSLEEKNVLDDVLYQLRSLYVAASR